MIRLNLDLRKVPLTAIITIGPKDFRLVITRNNIGGYPVLRLEDPRNGRVLWTRPLHYGMDALYGFCQPGCEGYGIIPITLSVGLRGLDAHIFSGTVPVYLIPGTWKGHEAYPRWRVLNGEFVEEADHS